MTHAREIVEAFMRAFYAGDAESARRYLHDDLAFEGPAANFSSADDYLSTSRHVAAMIVSYEIQRIFEDADDVCVFSLLQPKRLTGPILIADWYHLQRERIASIRTIFDTGAFAPASAEPGEDSVVDPVCHMRVQTTTESPRRTWRNGAYHFCSEGCARAFGSDPDRYVLIDEGDRRVQPVDRDGLARYPVREADSQ